MACDDLASIWHGSNRSRPATSEQPVPVGVPSLPSICNTYRQGATRGDESFVMIQTRIDTKPTAADRAALIKQIKTAFASVPYPGDEGICRRATDADRQLGTEEVEIEAAFRSRHWTEVPLEIHNAYQSALSFFSTEAFRYYLPAFLLAT